MSNDTNPFESPSADTKRDHPVSLLRRVIGVILGLSAGLLIASAVFNFTHLDSVPDPTRARNFGIGEAVGAIALYGIAKVISPKKRKTG